ncbi:MAG TPA: SUMF1/EgtB/PvdO family nonheme iron enzyme [Saprospiraceae bacterium]|nr:SUMF1/EgtB/PvdO family nonheme iron enzyme [Saprospiraceae bacterium]
MPETKPVNIFIAYAHADEAYLRPLRKHLALLEDDGVSIWYDGEILPGEEWDTSIKKRLSEAHIILLLVSADFLTSDYVIGTELPTALGRHAAGECTVVPVIVRNCLWQKKLGALQALPVEAFPIENWSSRDSAYHNIAEGVDKLIIQIKVHREEAERHRLDPFHNLMVLVEGGAFKMGSNKSDIEKPIHLVTVPNFYICKYPVTQGHWKQIMGEYNDPYGSEVDDNRPVELVSWDDAQEFIKKLNELTGQRYRLPTEAEWEYAARGGNQREGFEFAGSDDVDKVAWRRGISSSAAHPVGQKAPNELGLYDLSGNVFEWCEDVWHENYEKAPTDGSAWIVGGDESYRVKRGGFWNDNPEYARVAGRSPERPDRRIIYFGFRVVKDF